ncbi:MAG: hypothetical protein ACLRMZ_18810 [Blautia marasmi]
MGNQIAAVIHPDDLEAVRYKLLAKRT